MKKERQQLILELITKNVIETQEDLQETLCKSGSEVTQATISRDIKELKIVKALDSEGRYRYIFNQKYGSESSVRFVDIFSNSVISIDYAMNDVVIKCHSGMAPGACAALDNLYGSMVVGTLAGDDTILAITRNEEAAKTLTDRLITLIK
ncbi:MAG: arginine repressor [Oscillospiraceae bacterium]|nr:arginine repressor [Oscillospiraceae bacterium]